MDDKEIKLREYIVSLGRVAVAFSGGVDSTYLLSVAAEMLGDNAVAITSDSPALPGRELDDAKRVARHIGARHIILTTDEIIEQVRINSPDRCYHCKKHEFTKIISRAADEGITTILDGSNADDTGDYRPGMKATDELGVISPLLKFGITKNDIRRYSEERSLPVWDKPAYACLYSRIPYGRSLDRNELKRVELSEEFLISKGFRNCRVRCHGEVARIELLPADIETITSLPLREETAVRLRELGFRYITVDIEGYRTGSLNEVL